MPVSCSEIIDIIERKYPPMLAESYDNVGLLLGDPKGVVSKILVCLDINAQVIAKAIQQGAEMIISHHPFIFKPVKKIIVGSHVPDMIYQLIHANISVYALHTNFDNASDGLNDILANLIDLKDVQKLSNEMGTGRYGMLAEDTNVEQLCMKLKEVFHTDSLRMIGNPMEIVRKVAVVGGAGSDFISDAVNSGCKVMVTGDMKYHEALDAMHAGINVIDVGHYCTESTAMPYLAQKIQELTGVLTVCPECDSNPFITI